MRSAYVQAFDAPMQVDGSVEVRDPRPGEILVRVAGCGICHSDLYTYQGGLSGLPIVLGHEAAGTVEVVGDEVRNLRVGDKVVLTPIPPCGQCYWCLRGEPGVCINSQAIMSGTFTDGTTGLSREGATVYRGLGVGGFAEYVVTSENGAVKVPDDTALDVACVIGCAVQTGVGAVLNTARVEQGATVLVLGLGGIGLSVVQGARIAGAGRIIASDPLQPRRDAALKLGATDAIDPTSDDVAAAAIELTGLGVDYAFEAAGKAALIEVGIAATRTGGTTVAVGAPGISEGVTINPAVLFTAREKKLFGCLLGSSNSLRDIPRLVSLWRNGHLDLESMVTARRPLDEINDAFADADAGVGIRTVISV